MQTLKTSGKNATPYWRKVRALTLVLLIFWSVVNFGVIFYARELSSIMILGWSVPFYMAAQGMTLIYLLIIGSYALIMNTLDKREARDDVDSDPESRL